MVFVGLFLALAGASYLGFGLFIVQPIGAVPKGATVLYWRFGTNMPFVASADGILFKNGQGVSLLGRGIVLAKVGEMIQGRKVVSLPYSRTLFLVSTGGRECDR